MPGPLTIHANAAKNSCEFVLIHGLSAKMNKPGTKMNTCGGGGCSKTVARARSPQFAPASTQSKIVKIGELADFRPMRPRCTKYLRKPKSAHADFRSLSHFPTFSPPPSTLDSRPPGLEFGIFHRCLTPNPFLKCAC